MVYAREKVIGINPLSFACLKILSMIGKCTAKHWWFRITGNGDQILSPLPTGVSEYPYMHTGIFHYIARSIKACCLAEEQRPSTLGSMWLALLQRHLAGSFNSLFTLDLWFPFLTKARTCCWICLRMDNTGTQWETFTYTGASGVLQVSSALTGIIVLNASSHQFHQ